jgi:iron complex transport system substrate-binding protein
MSGKVAATQAGRESGDRFLAPIQIVPRADVSMPLISILRSPLLLLLSVSALLGAEPRRIISTAPGITEIVFALGLGDRLVGATEYCVYPPEARKIPRTGSWVTPNLEAIVAARPDLVIVQKTAVHSASRFNALNLKTLEVQLLTVEDIYATIEAIGRAAEVPGRASALSASIRAGLDEVWRRVSGRPPVSYLFVVGRSPGSLEGIVAVGPQSYQNEVLSIAGGRNALADAPVPYPKVLHEELLSRNPEVIIDMGEHPDAGALAETQKQKEIALWRRYPSLRAVKTSRVYPVSSAIFVVPGPRVVELARECARMLHRETFR